MGKNDKKSGDKAAGKGKAGGADKEAAGGKAKGAQSINVRHILVCHPRTRARWCFLTEDTVREARKEGGGLGKAE